MINSPYKLLLASSSPRRSEILKKSGYDFQVIPSFGETDIVGKISDENILRSCAISKAKESTKAYYKNLNINDYEKNIIISADTTVIIDGIIYGKAKDYDDAFNTLKKLSGKSHKVATAIALLWKYKDIKESIIVDVAYTEVFFKEISKDDEIHNYLNIDKPFDKAGSYGIQDEHFNFLQHYEGEYDTIMGFSIKTFEELYRKTLDSIDNTIQFFGK